MPAFIVKLLGLSVLLAATQGNALTLGRVHGAALIGRGLDVSVQVQLDAGQTAASACFEADVFHADSLQDPSRVQVRVEPTRIAQTVNVRVLSSQVIDEPIVTVYLRAGCGLQTGRRYVLLADIVSEQTAPPLPRVAQVPLVVPTAALAAAEPVQRTPWAVAVSASRAGVATGRSANGQSAATSTLRVARVAKRRAAAPKKASTKVAPAPADKKAGGRLQGGPTAGQPRLTLESMELLSDRVASLESGAVTAPQAASGSLDAERLAALEANVKTLVALATRNEASLLDLRTRLRAAESERYLNPVIYGLAALLLLSLVGLVYLLLLRSHERAATADNWWQGTEEPHSAQPPRTTPEPTRESGFTSTPTPSTVSHPGASPDVSIDQNTPLAKQVGATPAKPTLSARVDVSQVEMSESTFDRLMQSGAAHDATRKPRPVAPSAPGELAASAPGAETGRRRSINSDELFDIRQRAEFFVSLGQTEQAVEILENRIAEHGESSPQAFLDLLKLFHSLGLKADFNKVREDFNLLFNARVPEFARYGDDGKALEEYPQALQVVTATWATPKVLETIEGLLFRDRLNSRREQFDLAAFVDLLMLDSIAQSQSPGARYGATASGVASLPTVDALPQVDIDFGAVVDKRG